MTDEEIAALPDDLRKIVVDVRREAAELVAKTAELVKRSADVISGWDVPDPLAISDGPLSAFDDVPKGEGASTFVSWCCFVFHTRPGYLNERCN